MRLRMADQLMLLLSQVSEQEDEAKEVTAEASTADENNEVDGEATLPPPPPPPPLVDDKEVLIPFKPDEV